jgi:hypothetical protein
MPGTYFQGGAARVRIGSSSPPGTLFGGLKQWDAQGTRTTAVDDFYNGEASDTSIGKANRRFTASGSWGQGDAALAIAKTAFDDDTGPIIFISYTHDGTNGEILPVRASNFQSSGPNPNQKGTYNTTFEQAGAPTDLAGGLT